MGKTQIDVKQTYKEDNFVTQSTAVPKEKI